MAAESVTIPTQELANPAELDTWSYKQMIRVAGERQLIADVEAWFDYREKRNLTSHTTYDPGALVLERLVLVQQVRFEFIRVRGFLFGGLRWAESQAGVCSPATCLFGSMSWIGSARMRSFGKSSRPTAFRCNEPTVTTDDFQVVVKV